MERRRSIGFAGLGVMLGLLILAGPVVAADGSVRIREVNDRYSFDPTTVYANVGGSVTWTNGTDAPHTVTSNSGSELGSSNIADGQTFNHTFTATGTFAYHCTIHTYMKGTVIVLAAGAALPATDIAPTAGHGSNGDPVGPTVVVLAGLLGLGLAFRRLRPAR
jgi:plastocyanin